MDPEFPGDVNPKSEAFNLLFSIEWHLIRLGGPAHGIVTKTVHKTLPAGGGGQGGWWVWRYRV